MTISFAEMPTSSSPPQPQENQGQRLSRGRGISRNSLKCSLSGVYIGEVSKMQRNLHKKTLNSGYRNYKLF